MCSIEKPRLFLLISQTSFVTSSSKPKKYSVTHRLSNNIQFYLHLLQCTFYQYNVKKLKREISFSNSVSINMNPLLGQSKGQGLYQSLSGATQARANGKAGACNPLAFCQFHIQQLHIQVRPTNEPWEVVSIT